MIRALVIAVAFMTLGACTGATGNAWYESGDTTYDSLKAATDACKAKGGEFTLKNGGDPTHMGDYGCVRGKGH